MFRIFFYFKVSFTVKCDFPVFTAECSRVGEGGFRIKPYLRPVSQKKLYPLTGRYDDCLILLRNKICRAIPDCPRYTQKQGNRCRHSYCAPKTGPVSTFLHRNSQILRVGSQSYRVPKHSFPEVIFPVAFGCFHPVHNLYFLFQRAFPCW